MKIKFKKTKVDDSAEHGTVLAEEVEGEETPNYTEEENEEYDQKVKDEVNREMFKRLFKDFFVDDTEAENR